MAEPFDLEKSREWTLNALALVELFRRRADGYDNSNFDQDAGMLIDSFEAAMGALVGMANLVEVLTEGYSQLTGRSMEEVTEALREIIINSWDVQE